MTAKDLQRLEKQRKLAQTLRLKADADENGEDLERKKAWEWSIEQNDRWEAKQAESAVRGDTNFHGESACYVRMEAVGRMLWIIGCWGQSRRQQQCARCRLLDWEFRQGRIRLELGRILIYRIQRNSV